MMGSGDNPITNTVTVVAPPIPEFSALLSMALMAMLILLLCDVKRRRLHR